VNGNRHNRMKFKISIIGRVHPEAGIFSGLDVLEGMLTRDRERVHMEDIKV